MEKKLTNSENLFILLLYFIVTLFASFSFFSTWSIDYGIYYSTSKSITEGKLLYEDMFTHKGPGYFFFLSLLGNLFGWGGYKIVIPYACSILYLLASNYYFLKELNIEKKQKIFLYVIFVGFFSFQNGNASLVYFQIANILFSITFILKFYNRGNLIYFTLSFFFISIAILTRIDSFSIFFALIFLLIITKKLNI